MCLIIINKNDVIKDELLINSWLNNRDGAGLATFINDKLVINKFKNLDKFLKKYRELRSLTKSVILIHFRLATAGDSETTRNLMPFRVKNFAFAHNGHMSDLDVSNVYSDSFILSKMLNGIYNKVGIEGIVEVLQNIRYQKFAILTKNSYYYIGNFHEFDGNIYSNFSYESYNKKIKNKFYDDYLLDYNQEANYLLDHIEKNNNLLNNKKY